MIVLPLVSRKVVGAHQRSVIKELDRWAIEYSLVTDRDSAIRAACMIDYASNYYTPSDGYRADAETEQRLQVARQRCVTKIATAISAYTGTIVSDPLDWSAAMCDNTRQIHDVKSQAHVTDGN